MESNPKKQRLTRSKTKEISQDEETANVSTVENNSADNNDYTWVLNYDIFRMMFKYFDGQTLGVSSIVCRAFKEAIEKELLLRGPESFLTNVPPDGDPIIDTIIDRIRIKPKVAICFCQSSLQISSTTCLCSRLPRICDVIYIEYTTSTNDPNEFEQVSSMFLPYFKDFDIKTFCLPVKKEVNDNFLQKVLNHHKDKKKCLLVFSEEDSEGRARDFLHFLKETMSENTLSLTGGRAHELFVCKYNGRTKARDCKSRAQLIIMSIWKPNMDSWSIVLKESCRTEIAMVNELTQFRQKIKLQKFTCAVMFACNARINNKTLEINAFKKVFPKIPLVIGHGDAEYGVNTLDYNPKGKFKRKFWYNYSTIFTVITYS